MLEHSPGHHSEVTWASCGGSSSAEEPITPAVQGCGFHGEWQGGKWPSPLLLTASQAFVDWLQYSL